MPRKLDDNFFTNVVIIDVRFKPESSQLQLMW